MALAGWPDSGVPDLFPGDRLSTVPRRSTDGTAPAGRAGFPELPFLSREEETVFPGE
jgi:hypothetical protein